MLANILTISLHTQNTIFAACWISPENYAIWHDGLRASYEVSICINGITALMANILIFQNKSNHVSLGNQCILVRVILSCFRFAKMCLCQVSLLSRYSPRYLTSSFWGSCTLFIYSGGGTFLFVLVTRMQVKTLNKQQTSLIQSNTQTNLDLRNTTLGYGFHIQYRNFGAFPV
jgi:hypothetical protein